MEVLEKAKALLAGASGADELRMLQAVVFPLEYGMSALETASAIGRGATWASKARNSFIRSGGEIKKGQPRPRNRAHLAKEEEACFLEPFIEEAKKGGVLIVSAIHAALEARLGRKVARATAYNLLHRHGWRKLAPDRRHVSADPAAQEEWKKNSRPASGRSKSAGKGRAR
jgi:transposase